MPMLITTQDGNVTLNWQYIRFIFIRPCEAENEETGETHDAWAIAADVQGNEHPFILGFYSTEQEAMRVHEQILFAFAKGEQRIFDMPQDE